MNVPLWCRIRQRFIGKETPKKRYSKQTKTDNKQNIKTVSYTGDNFNGIIKMLTRECGGNVEDKGIVLVTSTQGYGSPPKCVADLDDLSSTRYTNSDQNGFIQYDFKEKKVKPSYYTIRSRNANINNHHLKSWAIDGSNNGENDWKVLDTQDNVSYLNGPNAFHTFQIKENLGEKEFYRFLRLRITGPTTSSSYQICITGIEFFGSII